MTIAGTARPIDEILIEQFERQDTASKACWNYLFGRYNKKWQLQNYIWIPSEAYYERRAYKGHYPRSNGEGNFEYKKV